MLNRSQIYKLLILHKRQDNLFGQLPIELIREITEFGQDPNSDFVKALHLTAYGELKALKKMLAAANNSPEKIKLKELLLLTGTVVTPAGITVKNTTLLECAIGSGDPDMVALIKSFFLNFAGGEREMERQLERYRPCIEAMSTQKGDDLEGLLEIIKASSLEDVLAELAFGKNYDPSYESNLRTAMNKFRADKLDPKNRIITKPRMHCNYQNLISAYALLDREWNHLKEGFNFGKIFLVARQIIGFIHLTELPAIDRFAYARGQVEEAGKEVERSFDFKDTRGSFPPFDKGLIDSHSGVGFASYVSICALKVIPDRGVMNWWVRVLQNLSQTKISNLQNLCPPNQNKNQPHM